MPTASSSSRSSVALWSRGEAAAAARPYSVAVAAPASALAEEALELEAAVFGERFGESRETLDALFALYDDATRFVVVRDERADLAVGMLRLVFDSPAGFPTLNALAGAPWHVDPERTLAQSAPQLDPQRTFDIAMIAVRRGWGSGETSLLLFHQIACVSAEHGTDFWLALLDNKVLERMQVLGQPFNSFDGVEPGPYEGSPLTTPVWGDRAAAYARMDRRVYACVIEGDGLREISGPPRARERRFAR